MSPFTVMPGRSFSGPLPAVIEKESKAALACEAHVRTLAEKIGERHIGRPQALADSVDYISSVLHTYGYKAVPRPFQLMGKTVHNVEAILPGKSKKVLVVGAHYDSIPGSPGADDNASAVAGLLEIARLLNQLKPRVKYPLELVAYDLEEPPYYNTKHMGSYRHAEKLSSDEEKVHFMISLEMIGYFSDESGSQKYPSPFLKLMYPSKGNFILVTGTDGEVLDLFTEAFPRASKLPLETFEYRIDLSDHMNYRDLGFRAVMVTDTAFYRNPNYHEPTDTPDTLDYARMAEVVKGVFLTVASAE